MSSLGILNVVRCELTGRTFCLPCIRSYALSTVHFLIVCCLSSLTMCFCNVIPSLCITALLNPQDVKLEASKGDKGEGWIRARVHEGAQHMCLQK